MNQKNGVVKLALISGMLIGLAMVALLLIFRLINVALIYTHPLIAFAYYLLIPFALLVAAGLYIRQAIDGYWTFGQAFINLVIAGVVAVVIINIYNYILFKYIDPALPAKIRLETVTDLRKLLLEKGIAPAEVNKQVDALNKSQFEEQLKPTTSNALASFLGNLILYMLLSLAAAAVVKRKPEVTLVAKEV